MKANNLTICIDAACNMDCPFCISKMTFAPKPDHELFCRNIQKAKYLAKAAGVSSVMITSKGEPTLNMEMVKYVLRIFKDFPTEIQTNGKDITSKMIGEMYFEKLNTLAVSVSGSLTEHVDLFEFAHTMKLNTRITLVLTDNLLNVDLGYMIDYCQRYHVSQITFRKATAPSHRLDTAEAIKTYNWIVCNTHEKHKQLFMKLQEFQNANNTIRKLPWGAIVYDVNGIAVTTIDYCIQDYNNWDDIRSLIYHQDGHMYTSWDKPSSLIF
jgi:organic radical activating enzyme